MEVGKRYVVEVLPGGELRVVSEVGGSHRLMRYHRDESNVVAVCECGEEFRGPTYLSVALHHEVHVANARFVRGTP